MKEIPSKVNKTKKILDIDFQDTFFFIEKLLKNVAMYIDVWCVSLLIWYIPGQYWNFLKHPNFHNSCYDTLIQII